MIIRRQNSFYAWIHTYPVYSFYTKGGRNKEQKLYKKKASQWVARRRKNLQCSEIRQNNYKDLCRSKVSYSLKNSPSLLVFSPSCRWSFQNIHFKRDEHGWDGLGMRHFKILFSPDLGLRSYRMNLLGTLSVLEEKYMN